MSATLDLPEALGGTPRDFQMYVQQGWVHHLKPAVAREKYVRCEAQVVASLRSLGLEAGGVTASVQ